MKKCFLGVAVTLFAATSLVLADEKVKLTDYKKWPVHGPYSSFYATFKGCTGKQTTEELSKLLGAEDARYTDKIIELDNYQYKHPLSEKDVFVDLIENPKGEPWLIFYHDEEVNYLFRRERFLIFGHRWKYVGSLSEKANDDSVIAFQVKNCLFFPFI